MARFEAQVWVSGELPYQVEVNAPNVFAAKKQIVRREGVKEHEVNRIFEIQEESSSSSSSGSSFSASDVEGSWALIGLVCAIGIAWWLLPWVLLGGAGFGSYKLAKNRVSGKNASLILAAIVSTSSIVGFASGTAIKAEYNSQSEVEEVKSLNETN